MNRLALVALLSFACCILFSCGATAEINTLIIQLPNSQGADVQIVPTDKDKIEVEADGKKTEITLSDNDSTGLVNFKEDNKDKGNKDKGNKGNKDKGNKGKGNKDKEDSESAGNTLKAFAPLFVGLFTLFSIAGLKSQSSRSGLLIGLLVIAVCLLSVSEGGKNKKKSITVFIPENFELLNSEYFVVYEVQAGGTLTIYLFRKNPSVVVIAATSAARLQNVVTGLGSVGFLVTSFDATTSTPTSRQISNFDYALVFSDPDNQFLDSKTLGNNLAKAFSAGVKISTATFANAAQSPLKGKFGTASKKYIFLDPTATAISSSASLGSVLASDAFLSAGVSSFSATNAWATDSSIINKGRAAFSWSDGRPLIVAGTVKGRRRTDINFFPVSNSTSDSGLWVGDGWKLLRNALLYNA